MSEEKIFCLFVLDFWNEPGIVLEGVDWKGIGVNEKDEGMDSLEEIRDEDVEDDVAEVEECEGEDSGSVEVTGVIGRGGGEVDKNWKI